MQRDMDALVMCGLLGALGALGGYGPVRLWWCWVLAVKDLR